MSKAKLEFNLPDEESEFLIASKAMSWALTVWDIDQKLREWLKYGHEFKNPDDALEEARKILYEILDERNLSLDEIG